MLNILRLSDYAVLILIHLAQEPERPRSAATLAQEIALPLTTIRKVLRILAQNGIVRARKGVLGGSILAFPAEGISLAQVLIAMEDPVLLTPCCQADFRCTLDTICRSRTHWMRINRSIRAVLEETTLADMVTQPDKEKR
ncbi:MAG: SUF system Fe-S cluster assembly regulator [Magnetococcus sp. YQC-9]